MCVTHSLGFSGVWKYGFYLNWACFSWASSLFFPFLETSHWRSLNLRTRDRPFMWTLVLFAGAAWLLRPASFRAFAGACRSLLSQTPHTHAHTHNNNKNPHTMQVFVGPNLTNRGSAAGKFDGTVNRSRANWKQTLRQQSFKTRTSTTHSCSQLYLWGPGWPRRPRLYLRRLQVSCSHCFGH